VPKHRHGTKSVSVNIQHKTSKGVLDPYFKSKSFLYTWVRASWI